MKTKLNFNKTILNLLIAVFFLSASFELTAQEKKSADLKDFKIVVEKTDNGIKMKCIEGSAWIDLSFSQNNNKPQAIDEYGMTELNKVSLNKDPKISDFLFTLTKTEKGISLKGIEGTAWTELSFGLLRNNQRQAINQLGMASLN